MGMWTELYLAVELKKNVPLEVTDTLRQLLEAPARLESYSWPSHRFFKTDRFWKCLDDDCYYFDSRTVHELVYDTTTEYWFLTVISKVKNYDEEYQHFIDWLAPYINSDGHIGHLRYESNEMPTLLFASPKGVVQITPDEKMLPQ